MTRYLVILVCIMMGNAALARPAQQTISKENNRLKVTLIVLQQYVPEDPTNYCVAQVVYNNGDKEKFELKEGDDVEVLVREDDAVGDEDFWTYSFEVTAAEAAAGKFDRTFSCISNFHDDGAEGGVVEFQSP